MAISANAQQPAETAMQSPWTGSFTVRPATEHIGADLLDIDLAAVVDDDLRLTEIRALLSRYLVLRIRGQHLSSEQAVRFTTFFGPLIDVRRPQPRAVHVPGFPEIQILSNATDEQGRRVGDGNTAAQVWHTDSGQWEVPPAVVLFYARKTPSPAPMTRFLNMIKVYESLPERTKERIAPLKVRHHMYSQSVDADVDRNGPSLSHEHRAAGMAHPLVRRHMGTHQPILYLPTRRDSVIDGLSDEEATALVTELRAFADASPFKWEVALEVDDVVLWDNAAILHCREGWPEDQDRIMWHLLSSGEQPTPMFPVKTVNANNVDDIGGY